VLAALTFITYSTFITCITMTSIHLVCPQCDSVVRVPADRLDAGPKCPKCRSGLIIDQPLELNTARFEKHLTRSELPLVVDFWAPWCGPCRMMAPHFEEAARRLGTKARFVKINSDEEPALSSRFGIRGIPTLIVFKNGKEAGRQSGAMDAHTLARWLTPLL
jgi:thioredoxin 2